MPKKQTNKPKAYVFIPDLHFPYSDWGLIKELREYCDDLEKDHAVEYVQLGDVTDQKAWSRWPKMPDDDSPELEWLKAERDMKRFNKMFPKITVVWGNHDWRAAARALDAGVPAQLIKSMDQVFDFPGWTWHAMQDPLYLADINCYVLHGDETHGNVKQKAQRMGASVVQGHSHQGSLHFLERAVKGQHFAMECGCIIDKSHKAFRYAARNPVKVFLGFGVVVVGEDGKVRPYLESLG